MSEGCDLLALVKRITKTATERAEDKAQFIDKDIFVRIELESEIYGLLLFADAASVERMKKRFLKEEEE